MQYKNVRIGLMVILCSEIFNTFLVSIIFTVLLTEDVGVIDGITTTILLFVLLAELIGINIAAKEEAFFKNARNVVIIAMIQTVVTIILDSTGILTSATAVSVVNQIFTIMINLFVLRAIRNMYEAHGESVRLVKLASIFCVGFVGLGVLLQFWGATFLAISVKNNLVAEIMFFIFILMTLASNIIYYVVLVKAMRRSKTWNKDIQGEVECVK
ncbi:MAG: hypothetical protein K5644_00850 [Lachnospiraceae bacterium]|nr:hypothetical protein [Lachnospiraceae bacterium]